MTRRRVPAKSGKGQGRRAASFAGTDLFVGLDVAKKSWKVTVRTRELVLRAMTVPPSADGLARCLERTWPGASFHLTYEAGCFGYWVYDTLVPRGIDVLVVAPHQLPRDLVKTDRLDSAKLARLLASGLLRGIWIPSQEARTDRSIVRRRAQLLRNRVHAQNLSHPTPGAPKTRFQRLFRRLPPPPILLRPLGPDAGRANSPRGTARPDPTLTGPCGERGGDCAGSVSALDSPQIHDSTPTT